jgi:eukaryotic-like serine/threonine-protein kinase
MSVEVGQVEVGQVIEGKYRIVRLIGEGGMGAVYEGENVRIHRRVAIKVLLPAFTNNTDVVQRFEREAQAAGRIGNDHILEVLDLGTLPDGSCFMVMEYLDGEPFNKRIQSRGRLTPRELAPLGKQMLKGLGAAHNAGIVHRDLKPENIFILREKAGKADYIKIIDFGISKFQPLSGDGMKMTRTGTVMGTPYYMSPEQASGSREADARSDVYAIGVIFYEAVTGHVPFDAPTFNQLLFKIVLSEPPPPRVSVPDLDPAFESIILKAMARDINVRFQSTEEFASALEAWEQTGVGVPIPPPAVMDGLVPGARASMASSPEFRVSSLGTGSNPGVGTGSNPGVGTGSNPGVGTGSNPGVGTGPGQWSASQPGVPAAHAPSAVAQVTPGNWATSQPDVGLGAVGTPYAGVPGKKSGLPMLLAAAATLVALVVVVGIVIASKSGDDDTTPAVDPAASSVAVPTSETANEPATAATSIPPPPKVEPLASSVPKPADSVAKPPAVNPRPPVAGRQPPAARPPAKRPGKKQQDDFGY